jgi:hypothetical protein
MDGTVKGEVLIYRNLLLAHIYQLLEPHILSRLDESDNIHSWSPRQLQ